MANEDSPTEEVRPNNPALSANQNYESVGETQNSLGAETQSSSLAVAESAEARQEATRKKRLKALSKQKRNFSHSLKRKSDQKTTAFNYAQY